MALRAVELILVAALCATATAARAQPRAEPARVLERGENLYFEGKYEEVLFLLEELSSRENVPPVILTKALKYVAFSYYLLNAREQARDAWLRLLKVHPSYQADPVEVSPELLEFFGSIEPPAGSTEGNGEPGGDSGGGGETEDPDGGGSKSSDDGGDTAEGSGDTAVQTGQTAPPPPPTDERGCGIVLCLLPAGIGQFANAYNPLTDRYRPGQIVKGVIFAVLEPVFLGLNIAFWALNEAERAPDGTWPNAEQANQRYALQMTFFGLTVGTVLVGILDAFLFY